MRNKRILCSLWFFLACLSIGFSQSSGGGLSLNNAYWEIKIFKAKKEIKESLYKTTDSQINVIYKKAFLLFTNDSLVLLSICNDTTETTSLFYYKKKDNNSLELYGLDKYTLPSERIIHKYPYLRKFKRYYMFSYSFKVQRITKNGIYFVSKNPRIRLLLKHIKDYTTGTAILNCSEW